MCDTKIFQYNRTKYSFFEKIQVIFNNFNTSLENLHTFSSTNTQVTFDNDTQTIFQKQFYESPYYEEFRNLYYTFVKDEIAKLFPDEEYLVVQKDPCFRVSVPNNTALGIKTDDSNNMIGLHSDSDYNHPPSEINYILSITELSNTNSVWVESSPMKGDFAPVTLRWNEYIQFYGNKLRHHNVKNISGQSRVSLDFRIIPFSKYDPTYEKKSVHGKRKFLIGDYFIQMKLK
jgi:hypothetical protein